jgi:hypothetical protein
VHGLDLHPTGDSPIVRWMTFCPEWLTGSPNLDTSNPMYLWLYLAVRGIPHISPVALSLSVLSSRSS